MVRFFKINPPGSETGRRSDGMGSIPGPGEATVAKIMAYTRWRSAALCQCQGLGGLYRRIAPVRESGMSVKGRMMICRTGHAALRKLAHLIYGVVKSGKPFSAKIAMPGGCNSRRYLTPPSSTIRNIAMDWMITDNPIQ